MQTGTQGTLLTWYPGSILPYASLWHTILRATALNRIRSGELPSRTAHTINLLHNKSVVIDTDALAKSLGENPSVFRWSHFGDLPYWLSNLITPGFRLCMDCLEQGYHSAFFSLKLLDACPIHGTQLFDRCECGRPFCGSISPADFPRAGYCECYKLQFFSRETCRQPKLDAKLTKAFDPIADWIEHISTFITHSFRFDPFPTREERDWLEDLFEMSTAFNLKYPDCFFKPTIRYPRSLTRNHSGKFSGPTTMREDTVTASTGTYWKSRPATWTYRALSRYIRRHVFRKKESIGTSFLTETGKLHRHHFQGANDSTVWALAEIMWSNYFEYHVLFRRWPHRDPKSTGEISFINTDLTYSTNSPQIKPAVQHWLEYQVAATGMLAIWRKAIEMANEVSRTHDLIRVSNFMDVSVPFNWSAEVRSDGSVLFVGLGSEGYHFPRLQHLDKRARIEALEKARERANLEIFEHCSGPCLTWTKSDGWFVTDAIGPQRANAWRCLKLFGLEGVKRRFWLFKNNEQFVARLCSSRLQTFGTSSRQAINALRDCVKQHATIYGCTE